jgi:hypothetical protein
MRVLFVASACVLVLSGPALACRGTPEYPMAFKQLEESNLPAERKKALKIRLEEGRALHDEGHAKDSAEKRRESLRILDAVVKDIGM